MLDSSTIKKENGDYNRLFEILVMSTIEDSEERLIGMLAYADYKEEKYRWKARYREKHQVTEISQEDVDKFLLSYDDISTLNRLRDSAEEMIMVFAERYSKVKCEEVLKDNIILEIKKTKSWWIAGLKGALGALFFSVLFCFCIRCISFYLFSKTRFQLYQVVKIHTFRQRVRYISKRYREKLLGLCEVVI